MSTSTARASNAADSMVANMTATMPYNVKTPASFNNNDQLLAISLTLAATLMFFSLMRGLHYGWTIFRQRRWDKAFHPVTIRRTIVLFACTGLFLRCLAEAMTLWAWSPGCSISQDCLELYARATMAKRWIDPLSYGCAIVWLALDVLGEVNMDFQLRTRPLPDNPFKRWRRLIRPAAIAVLCMIAAAGAVWLR